MSNRLRYPEFAPEGIATMRATEHYLNATTALPSVLLELVRLRVSLLNGCPFCVGHHTLELQKHNEPETRIAAVGRWAESDAFTPRERAALGWADSVTDITGRHAADGDYSTVSQFFHDKDLVDLTMAIASINAWNRLSIAFRAEWKPAKAGKHLAPASQPVAESPQGEPARTLASNPPSSDTVRAPEASLEHVVDDDGGKVAHD